MNETEHKYYVYSQNGLLINRVNFSNYIKKYGNPVATSPNGLNFIFQKSFDKIEDEQDLDVSSDEEDKKEQYLTLTVMNMSVFGMCHVKTINILQNINQYLENEAAELSVNEGPARSSKEFWNRCPCGNRKNKKTGSEEDAEDRSEELLGQLISKSALAK